MMQVSLTVEVDADRKAPILISRHRFLAGLDGGHAGRRAK